MRALMRLHRIEGGNHAGFGSYGQGGVAQGFPVNEPAATISQVPHS